MKFFFVKSTLTINELQKRSDVLNVLILDPRSVEAEEELALAYHLANKSFGNKRAIAKKFKYEFLLWLTGKTDIKSAMTKIAKFSSAVVMREPSDRNYNTMKKSEPKDAGELLVVSFGKETKKELLVQLEASELNERKFVLNKNAGPLRLEEISLSRVKN